MIGVLLILVGSIVLARQLWNRTALPKWAPRWAIVLFVLAIAELPLSAVGWWLPHGPVLLYVGIAGYGVALITSTTGASASGAEEHLLPAVTSAA
jgi:hypothetical protein